MGRSARAASEGSSPSTNARTPAARHSWWSSRLRGMAQKGTPASRHALVDASQGRAHHGMAGLPRQPVGLREVGGALEHQVDAAAEDSWQRVQ